MEIMYMNPPGINPVAPMQEQMRPTANERAMNPVLSAPSGSAGGPVLNPFMQPGYAVGGMVGPGGIPMDQQPMQQPMPGQAGMGMPQMDGQQNVTEADLQQFMQQNPEAVQQIVAELQQADMQGDIDPQAVQMLDQLLTVALNNPEMYPQMRQFALSQDIVDAEDLPEQYDPGYVALLLIAARSFMSAGAGAMNDMGAMQNGMEEIPSFADGGFVKSGDNASAGGKVTGPGTTTSDSIPIRVSTGEYVIPAHIVQMKGKEFFDKMLDNYRAR
jgi:hypothetical protein